MNLSQYLLEGLRETTIYMNKIAILQENGLEYTGGHFVDGQPKELRRTSYMLTFKGDQLKEQHNV